MLKLLAHYAILMIFTIQTAFAYDLKDFLLEIKQSQNTDFVTLPIQSSTRQGVSLIINEDLPNGGLIDATHLPFGMNVHSDEERAAYTLRTVAILDFLQTRLALKSLIGDDRIASLSSAYKIPVNLSVPIEAKRLMAHGMSHPIRPGSDLIDSIEKNYYPYNRSKRENMVAMLIFVATELVKIDMQMKFLEEDIWVNSNFSSEVNKLAVKKHLEGGGEDVFLSYPPVARFELKEKYKKLYGISSRLEELVAQREIMLDQYRLLGLDIDGKSFYTRIYEELERHGFPSREIDQRVSYNQFPDHATEIVDPLAINVLDLTNYSSSDGKNHEMEMSVSFGSMMSEKITLLNSSSFISTMVHKFSGSLDKLFLQMLEANTLALKKYSENISFGSNSQLYMDLGQFPQLWGQAKEFFAPLQLDKQLEAGRKSLEKRMAKQTSRTETIQMIFLGLGLALFTGAVMASWGAATPALTGWLGVSATTLATLSGGLMTASGAVAAVGSIYYWIDRSRVAEKLKLFYFGGRYVGPTAAEIKNALEIQSTAAQSALITFFMSGIPARAVFSIAAGMKTVGTRVLVTSQQVLTFARATNISMSVLSRVNIVAAMAKIKMQEITHSLLILDGNDNTALVQRALLAAQKLTKMGRSDVLKGIQKTPIVGKWMKSFYAQHLLNIENNPYYFSYMMQDMKSDLIIMAAADLYFRGPEDFVEEWPFVLTNTLSTVGIIFGIHYYIAANMKSGMAIKGLIEVGEGMSPNLLKLGAVGAAGAFFGSLGAEAIDEFVDDSSATIDERAKRILYTTLLLSAAIGISSNVRSTYINGWVRPRIHRNLVLANGGASSPAVEATFERINWGISYANNMIGSGMFVYFAKSLGIQDNEFSWAESMDIHMTDEGELPYYLFLYDDRDPQEYLFPAV